MKYIAMTIGPITRTIEMAENTRGLWAASYLFSYLGKKLIEPFRDKNFLLPYIPKQDDDEMDIFTDKYKGTGLFPDRYIFEAEDVNIEDVNKHVENVFEQLAKDMTSVINRSFNDKKYKRVTFKYANKEDVELFLKNYFKVYFFEKDFEEGENVKAICEQSLALLEMQDSFTTQINDTHSYLNRFFGMVSNSFLSKDAGINNGFKSIVEISSNADAEIPKHPYQCYIAVVKADGDSMGKAFSQSNNPNKLSKALLEFNKDAVVIIDKYEGQPVYIGGDDLLFFAPVLISVKTEKGVENKSLFSLLEELDNAFHHNISNVAMLDEALHPTLSFGISVSFYKYPMFEALALAEDLLSKAKATGCKEKNALKNNIIFSIQKHSGQTRQVLLHKGHDKLVKMFNHFIDTYLLIENTTDSDEKNKNLLTSVMHGLREKGFLLSLAVKDEKKLNNFFNNNFNEPIHKKHADFFRDLKELLQLSYMVYVEGDTLKRLRCSLPDFVKKDNEPVAELVAIETAYNVLHFIHFINKRNNDQDENV